MSTLSARHRHHLKGREIQEILGQLGAVLHNFNWDELKESKIEVSSIGPEESLYFIEGKPGVLKIGESIFPTLVNNVMLASIPTITVDAGAVSHICNGSALMAPGIVKIEGVFSMNATVAVKEITYGKTIALAKSLLGSQELAGVRKGKAALTVHYVGDKYWRIYRDLV
jgi:predicted RNA-binding protein (TIGR00451 family)